MTGSGGAALGTEGIAGGGGGSRGMDAQGGAAGQGGNGGSIGSGGSGGDSGGSGGDAADRGDVADTGDVVDAANDAPVGGAGPDGGAHGAPSLADASVDLPLDAALGGEAFLDASTTWCQASTHLFCADFDGDPYTANWTDQIAIGFGKISKTTALSKSAPAAFLSAITTPDLLAPQARLRKLFAPRPTNVNLEFDLFLEDPRLATGPPGQAVEIFSIMQEGPQYSTGIRLLRGGSTVDTTYLTYQRVGGSSYFDMKGNGLPTGRWVHVALTFVPPGTANPPRAGSVTLTVDGTTLASYPQVIDVDYYAATSTATVLSIGLSTIGTQELIMSATYDNVTFDIAP